MTNPMCEACGVARGECLTPVGDGAAQMCWRCAHNIVHHEMAPDAVDFPACACAAKEIYPSYMADHTRRLRQLAVPIASTADIEDLVQETFARALRYWLSYRPGTSMRGWLFSIMRTVALNLTRDRKRHTALQARHAIDLDYIREDRKVEPHTDGIGDADIATAVRAAIAELPPMVRDAVTAVAIDGKLYREAAISLGMPEGTVMSRVFRGRVALRAALAGKR